MTKEILEILVKNIDNIELIKKISLQNDYIIENIVQLFSEEKQRNFILNHITKYDQYDLIEKALLCNDSTKTFAILSLLEEKSVLFNRGLNAISIMCNSINIVDKNGLDDRLRVFTNKEINEKIDFPSQLQLFYDDIKNIKIKLRLIHILTTNCKDFNTNNLGLLNVLYIINEQDNKKLYKIKNYLSQIDKEQLNVANCHRILFNDLFNYNEEEKEVKNKIEVKDNTDSLYIKLKNESLLEYRYRIMRTFQEGNKVYVLLIKNIRNYLTIADDIETLKSIYDVCSNEKVKEKLDIDQRLSIISSMSEFNSLDNKIIAKILTSDHVLDNRNFKEIQEIINTIFNNNQINIIGPEMVLLNKGVLKYRTEEEAMYLLNELNSYEDINNLYNLFSLIKLDSTIDKTSFTEQKEILDLLKKYSDSKSGIMIKEFFDSTRILDNKSFEERKKIMNKVLEINDITKKEAIYDFVKVASLSNTLSTDDLLNIVDIISKEPSSKSTLYISEILKKVVYDKNYDKNNMLILLNDNYRASEEIEKLKEKIRLTRNINSCSNIDDVKKLVKTNINK